MSTARSSRKGTARSSRAGNTSRSNASTKTEQKQEDVEEVEVDIFEKWRDDAPEAGPERAVLVIKPDALDDHEEDIVAEVEDMAEEVGLEITECSRIQLTKEKAINYCLAVQESRADELKRLAEEERLAAEEAARIAAEEEAERLAALGSAPMTPAASAMVPS